MQNASLQIDAMVILSSEMLANALLGWGISKDAIGCDVRWRIRVSSVENKPPGFKIPTHRIFNCLERGLTRKPGNWMNMIRIRKVYQGFVALARGASCGGALSYWCYSGLGRTDIARWRPSCS
jgi:hypothetical protein